SSGNFAKGSPRRIMNIQNQDISHDMQRKRKARNNETAEQRETRLAHNHKRKRKKRVAETTEE
ncbi:12335_t:CDS:1, partial [Dentiscutata erythropus]